MMRSSRYCGPCHPVRAQRWLLQREVPFSKICEMDNVAELRAKGNLQQTRQKRTGWLKEKKFQEPETRYSFLALPGGEDAYHTNAVMVRVGNRGINCGDDRDRDWLPSISSRALI